MTNVYSLAAVFISLITVGCATLDVSQLRTGMAESDVIAILGKPKEIKDNGVRRELTFVNSMTASGFPEYAYVITEGGKVIAFGNGYAPFIPTTNPNSKILEQIIEESRRLEIQYKDITTKFTDVWSDELSKINIDEVEKKAQEGDMESLFLLAAHFDNRGKIFPEDLTKAFKIVDKLANDGYSPALWLRAGYYQNGIGADQDKAKSFKDLMAYFKSNQNARAAFLIAQVLRSGNGVIQDEEESLAYLFLAESLTTLKQVTLFKSSQRLNSIRKDRHNTMMNLYKNYAKHEVVRATLGAPLDIRAAKHRAREILADINGVAKPPTSFTGRIKSTGTGFFITSNGHIITNYHVIEDNKLVKVKVGSNILTAKVLKSDIKNDLSLIKIEGSNYTALALKSSKSSKLGTDVFTLGFPKISIQGASLKLTKGSISSLSGAKDDPTRFQISAPIQPGNSGGPLLDKHGNVIGVIVSSIRGLQNVNYAIKGSVVLTFMESTPEISNKLASPTTDKNQKFEDMAERIKGSVVPILIY